MSGRQRTRLISPPSTELRPVPADLLLKNPGFMPRHQRLLVAAYALDTGCGADAAMRRALQLYQAFDPFELEAPGCSVSSVLMELHELVCGG